MLLLLNVSFINVTILKSARNVVSAVDVMIVMGIQSVVEPSSISDGLQVL